METNVTLTLPCLWIKKIDQNIIWVDNVRKGVQHEEVL